MCVLLCGKLLHFLSQFDSHGHNFMHKAVINEDVEAVVFLMSVRADVNSKVQNPSLNIPLHLAIKKGSEIIVRHLVSVCFNCVCVCCVCESTTEKCEKFLEG